MIKEKNEHGNLPDPLELQAFDVKTCKLNL